MTTYCLELYDKDNDIYEIIAYSDDQNKLRQWGRPIEILIKKDMVIRHCSDGTKEPFDCCRVREVKPGELPAYTGDKVFI